MELLFGRKSIKNRTCGFLCQFVSVAGRASGIDFAGVERTMKRIIIMAALLCTAFTSGAQHWEGTFTQTKTLQLSGRVIKSEGTVRYTAPDQLAMLYTKPEGDYFIIDGPILRMDMRGVAADINTENNKSVRAQRNAILYSLSGQYEEIAREMNAACKVTKTSGGGKHVSIKAKETLPKGYSGLELDYAADGRLTKMVLEEFGGISTEYVLSVR